MIETILYTPEQLAERIKQLATEIIDTLVTPENVVLVIVMEGAMQFAAALIQAMGQLGYDFPQTSIKTHSYDATTSSREPEISTLFKPNQFAGQRAFIIEDILDTGHTLQAIIAELLNVAGFAEIAGIACLFARNGAQEVPVEATNIGFVISSDAFIYGFGIDVGGQKRSLPHVAAQVD